MVNRGKGSFGIFKVDLWFSQNFQRPSSTGSAVRAMSDVCGYSTIVCFSGPYRIALPS